MRILSSLLLAAALVTVGGCSSDDDTGDAGALEVRVVDNSFSPSTKTVTTGQTVTWTWHGTVQHSVTFTGGITSPTQLTGSYTRTFTDAGTYEYHCVVHGQAMSGTITVTAPAGTGITAAH